MPIKSFRGLMTDNTQDTISLHTNNGSTGYRVAKFQLMDNSPGASSSESIIKIYSVPQTASTTLVDFSDQTLLAVGYNALNASGWYYADSVIFDNMTFNQDIYLTYKTDAGSGPCNYYIELEQVKLDLNENTVATLKDMRNLS